MCCMQGHDDDIVCLAMHPNRYVVATGQIASSLDNSYAPPYLCIWDTRKVHQVMVRIDMEEVKDEPKSKERDMTDPTKMKNNEPATRSVLALAFSGDGHRLVAVTGDNRHTINVFKWGEKDPKRRLLCTAVGHNGDPPQVITAAMNN